jgi:site-specific recombinase XerD
MDYRTLYEHAGSIMHRAGLADCTMYTLRHTLASDMSDNGESLQTIGKVLGHSHIATTMRYAHLNIDIARQAATRRNAAVSAGWLRE